MKWVYWAKLYNSKFQAGCVAKRMEEDWWIYGYEYPEEVEVFRTKRGKYGIRYIPMRTKNHSVYHDEQNEIN